MRALVVEDEILTALHLQQQLESLGLIAVGIASDRGEAMRLAEAAPDIAFVDLNLRDGPTGTEIAAALAQAGVRVFYVTANPSQIGEGRVHALGVIGKPWMESEIKAAVSALN